MKLLIGIIIILFCCKSALQAQDSLSVNAKKEIDERYIEKYSGIPAAYLSVYGKYNNISLLDTSGRVLIFRPNISLSFGPGFGYKWFGIDLSLISFGSKNESIYGKTKKVDIQSHIYLKRFIADFTYQNYKGFYLDSLITKPKDTTYNLHRVIKNPEMSQQSVGGTIMLFTNYRKFSYKSTFSQTEFQKKSAGTWAFGLSFHYLSINSKTCLLDDSVKKYFDSTSYYKTITSFNAGVMGGYFHTFTLHKWFTTVSLLGGFDAKFGSYILENNKEIKDTINASGHLQIRFGFGYNSNKVYFGFNLIGDGYFMTNSKQEYGTVRFYLGYRFAPKKEEK